VSHVSRVLDLLQAHPLHQMMGVSALQAQDGRAALEVEVTPERVNAVGMFHGGILYVISDLACLAALLTRLDEGDTAATHDLDRKSTRLNSSHNPASRMPSSA
jgi:uncharacterized protein (TIGR00369 family)